MRPKESDSTDSRPGWLARYFRRLVLGFFVAVAVGVALPFGCVGNRMFNTEPGDYLRRFETGSGLQYSVGVVEFDDQGEPWDLRQLDAVLAEIRRLNRSSEHGIILYQFVHGWKSNAARDEDGGRRLEWFETRISDIAEASAEAAKATGEDPRPVVGLYIGWRGRTYSLPILIDVSFWNRRVAAHRVASKSLNEVLFRSANVAKENGESKCALVGHSMGGMIVEKTLGPAVVSDIMLAEYGDRPVPLHYDLIVTANASTEALYSKQLIDVFKRTGVEMVLQSEAGSLSPTDGPMIVSITSERDGVTRFMVPIAMTFNSVFVRYRRSSEPGMPSQRRLGIRTAGHVPFLHSHEVVVRDGKVEIHEKPDRWNDTPFWIFQVPAAISADHSDIDGTLWGELMMQLMAANRVFDSDVRLVMTDVDDGAFSSAVNPGSIESSDSNSVE